MRVVGLDNASPLRTSSHNDAGANSSSISWAENPPANHNCSTPPPQPSSHSHILSPSSADDGALPFEEEPHFLHPSSSPRDAQSRGPASTTLPGATHSPSWAPVSVSPVGRTSSSSGPSGSAPAPLAKEKETEKGRARESTWIPASLLGFNNSRLLTSSAGARRWIKLQPARPVTGSESEGPGPGPGSGNAPRNSGEYWCFPSLALATYLNSPRSSFC
jgi:hypothetical protein